MHIKRWILSIIFVVMILLGVSLALLTWRINQDVSSIEISTDRRAYELSDTIRVSLRNQGEHAIDIYCQQFCALGNFPTAVEKASDGQWQYAIGFCPSIEPLFGSGVAKGDTIMHRLPAGGSFELELTNLASLRLEREERLRIVYYLGPTKRPVYSNEFTVGP